jgi:hypothetical protein
MNPAVAFTLILLSLMMGAGMVSASWGFTLGRQALTGIRQPEARPTSGTPMANANTPGEVVFAKEADILEQVKARMNGGVQ